MSRDASKWCLASASQDVASIIARNCRGISLRIRNWWVWKQPVHGFQRKFCERLIFFRLPSGQMQEKRGQAGGWFLILVLLPQVCFYLFNIVEFQELLHWVKILLLKSVFFKKKKWDSGNQSDSPKFPLVSHPRVPPAMSSCTSVESPEWAHFIAQV